MKIFKRLILIIIILIITIISIMCFIGYSTYSSALKEKPLLKRIEEITSNEHYVKFDDMSETYRNAVIAVEDHRYYDHGAIDFRQFFDFIEGLYFPSPYSWRDPNSLNPYEDSLGIFDLNRRKIIECLVKNGDYTKNSEVYVRRMERKWKWLVLVI